MMTQWGPSAAHSSPFPLFGPRLLCPNGRPSQQLLSSCDNWLAFGKVEGKNVVAPFFET